MSSANLFAQKYGSWIVLAMCFATSAGSMGLLALLFDRLKVKQKWIVLPALMAGFVGGLLFALQSPWPRFFGEYEAIYSVRGAFGERLAIVSKKRASGKSTAGDSYHVLVRRGESWRDLAFVTLPVGERYGAKGFEWCAGRGTYGWFATPAGYVVVDLAEPRIVGTEAAAAAGLGAYKGDGAFDSTTLELPVLLQNGDKRRLTLAEPPPTQPGVAIAPLDVANSCTTRKTSTYWRSSPLPEAAKLLRPTVVQRANTPCEFSFGGEDGLLALHKSTAFGDGRTLLSALKKSGERLFTVDLTERIGEDPKETLEILRAEVAQGRLSLLVGRKVTIYAIMINAGTGKVSSERALY